MDGQMDGWMASKTFFSVSSCTVALTEFMDFTWSYITDCLSAKSLNNFQRLVVQGQEQGLADWSSRIVEDKDFPPGQQHWFTGLIHFFLDAWYLCVVPGTAAGPHIWNSLPGELRAPGLSADCFKKDVNHTRLHRFDPVTGDLSALWLLLLARYK